MVQPKGLTGVETVMRNLNREIQKIKNRSMRGLIHAAILIRRDMETTPPLVPVDEGNLRASWFLVTARGNIGAGSGKFKQGKETQVDTARLSNDHSRAVGAAKGAVTGRPLVAIGFSAHYSVFQENDNTGQRKRPGAGGGFFESALRRNEPRILYEIRKEARIK